MAALPVRVFPFFIALRVVATHRVDGRREHGLDERISQSARAISYPAGAQNRI